MAPLLKVNRGMSMAKPAPGLHMTAHLPVHGIRMWQESLAAMPIEDGSLSNRNNRGQTTFFLQDSVD
jgi:hypothetical protein